MISDYCFNTRAIQGLRVQLQVPIEKECNAVTMLRFVGQHAMTSAAIVASCVFLHHVAHVDYKAIGDYWYRYPCFGGWVEYFETSCAWLLKQNRNATEVCMVGN